MTKITSYKITNHQGDSISIVNFGARLISWHTKVADEVRNIVLGYSKLEDYLSDPFFMGAIVGPYANRIAYARCEVDGKEITLSANEGQHQLHGGDNALANQFWLCSHHDENSLTLTCKLKDSFNGYPGDINVKVIYKVLQSSELSITLEVDSEKLTIAGPTAHPYFNLNKEQKSPEHSLKLNSEYYTPVDRNGIPIGEIKSVKGTSYDFLSLRGISSSCEGKILDDNFVIALTDTTTKQVSLQHATLVSEDKKLTLHAYSNYPAIQVYTGQYLKEPFLPNQGVCLEPQFTPDSPNQTIFPFHFTTPNQSLSTVIIYKLTK
jgi:aldose 1-epimerase